MAPVVPDYTEEDFRPIPRDENSCPAHTSWDPSLSSSGTGQNGRKTGVARLFCNRGAMAGLILILLILGAAFLLPPFYPYTYDEQLRGSENLRPMEYSSRELERLAAGETIFPHLLGTDNLGRDLAARLMTGAQISLSVGISAGILVLVIGSVYGAVAGFLGGTADLVMMRVVDLLYSIPDILIVILLSVTLKHPLAYLAAHVPAFRWIESLGVGLVCVFLVFGLLYWVGTARIIRAQVLSLRERPYITAARALGASRRRIIFRHLLPNCAGTLAVTAALQIPAAIFTESYLSFMGLGVAAPLPSLGSMAAQALDGIYSYPSRLLAPSLLITVIILAFHLLADGLQDALDPRSNR